MMHQSNDPEEMIQQTRNWVGRVVVGLNFCPFAKREMMRDSIRYVVAEAKREAEQVLEFAAELVRLEQDESIETTLVLFPKGYDDFRTYLDLLDLCQIYLEEEGYEGIFQLASFHPDYCFGGVAPDDPQNFTNRSPYPIIHILREDSLERVLEHYEHPEEIPENNIALTQKKGFAALQKILADCYKL